MAKIIKPTTQNILMIVEKLTNGEVIAIPTETVYGLAGNGIDENVVKNIFRIKGRPAITLL